MDDRLGLSVTHADGRITRWGPDEVEAGNVPSDLTFSTSMPGGNRDLSCSLLRRIDLDYPDQGLFDNVRAYGPGNRTAWDGRFTQFPRSHGQGFSVTPGAVGWAAHLRDDPSFREIYVDRDINRWRGPSNSRRYQLLAAPVAVGSHTAAAEHASGLFAVIMGYTGAWAQALGFRAEVWYDAGPGLAVSRMRHNWLNSTSIGAGGGSWDGISLSTGVDDGSSFPESSGDFLSAGTGTHIYAPATARRYMVVQIGFTAAGGVDGAAYEVALRHLTAYGAHGLTLTPTDEGPEGVYGSDVIRDVIQRAAPLLDPSGVEDTDFVIPHLIFPDPVTAEDAISLVNAYHLWEWGVFDDRVFFYRPTDASRLTWEARLDQGAFLDLEGDTAEQVFNGVYVSYQDAAGERKTIGPTGASADATSALLADTSETNPVNAHGIPRRWAKLEISQPTTQAGAEQLGYVWLREHSLPQRRGNLNLVGSVTHPTEGDVPVWRVRAGDYIRPTDMPRYVPRRIISTSYTHATRSLSCELDNTSLKLDAIIERALGVAMVGVL